MGDDLSSYHLYIIIIKSVKYYYYTLSEEFEVVYIYVRISPLAGCENDFMRVSC